jgi:hypothetical protein
VHGVGPALHAGTCDIFDTTMLEDEPEDVPAAPPPQPNPHGVPGWVPPAVRPVYKTVLCAYFLQGRCRGGQHCTYAHGDEELRVANQLGSLPLQGVYGPWHDDDDEWHDDERVYSTGSDDDDD